MENILDVHTEKSPRVLDFFLQTDEPLLLSKVATLKCSEMNISQT